MQDQAFPDLLSRCALDSDSELWREFVDRYGHRLTSGIRRALRRCGARVEREDRQDLLQEVYFRLLEKQGQRLRRCRAQGEQAVGAYLARIAESVVIDHLRAEAAAKRGRGKLVREVGEAEPELLERAVDRGPSPEDRMLLRERRRLFARHCRDAVGSRYARRDLKVLYLAFFEGWTSREISGRLGAGLTASSVDSMLHRVKRRLARAGLQIPRRA